MAQTLKKTVESQLFDIHGKLVSSIIRLNPDQDEQNEIVERFLYQDYFAIEQDLVTSWISSTLDSNELRNHDRVIRAVVTKLVPDKGGSSSLFVDISVNRIGDGFCYDFMGSNLFMMERQLITHIKALWGQKYENQFKGTMTIDEGEEQVSCHC